MDCPVCGHGLILAWEEDRWLCRNCGATVRGPMPADDDEGSDATR